MRRVRKVLGLNPIIATVFLIISAVVIGAMFLGCQMGWFKTSSRIADVAVTAEIVKSSSSQQMIINVKNIGNVKLRLKEVRIESEGTYTLSGAGERKSGRHVEDIWYCVNITHEDTGDPYGWYTATYENFAVEGYLAGDLYVDNGSGILEQIGSVGDFARIEIYSSKELTAHYEPVGTYYAYHIDPSKTNISVHINGVEKYSGYAEEFSSFVETEYGTMSVIGIWFNATAGEFTITSPTVILSGGGELPSILIETYQQEIYDGFGAYRKKETLLSEANITGRFTITLSNVQLDPSVNPYDMIAIRASAGEVDRLEVFFPHVQAVEWDITAVGRVEIQPGDIITVLASGSNTWYAGKSYIVTVILEDELGNRIVKTISVQA